MSPSVLFSYIVAISAGIALGFCFIVLLMVCTVRLITWMWPTMFKKDTK